MLPTTVAAGGGTEAEAQELLAIDAELSWTLANADQWRLMTMSIVMLLRHSLYADATSALMGLRRCCRFRFAESQMLLQTY